MSDFIIFYRGFSNIEFQPYLQRLNIRKKRVVLTKLRDLLHHLKNKSVIYVLD